MELELENKAINPVTTADIAAGFEDFMLAFEEFKSTNDSRLAELERRGAVDPLIEEKLGRIDATLDKQGRSIHELQLRAQRPRLAAEETQKGSAQSEHKAAFDTYIRRGDASAMLRLETKALSVISEADGGYLVPETNEREIMAALRADSPIRAIAGAITISTGVLKRPFAVGDAASGWVGETQVRPQTSTPTIAELSFPTMELYAMPAATLRLLDDAAVDIDAWLAGEVRATFAAQESRAFVVGDGVSQPKGFLSYPTVADRSWSWGKLGTVASGASGAFAATAPADALIDLVFSLKTAYRKHGRFVMNRLTQSAVRRLKDDDGNYLWQPSLGAGMETTLLGYPLVECDDMPDIAAGSLSIAFGDFSRGYLVVDRSGLHVLRDPFTAKPYVLFYTTKRVGGGVQDFNALKLLKFAAS